MSKLLKSKQEFITKLLYKLESEEDMVLEKRSDADCYDIKFMSAVSEKSEITSKCFETHFSDKHISFYHTFGNGCDPTLLSRIRYTQNFDLAYSDLLSIAKHAVRCTESDVLVNKKSEIIEICLANVLSGYDPASKIWNSYKLKMVGSTLYFELLNKSALLKGIKDGWFLAEDDFIYMEKVVFSNLIYDNESTKWVYTSDVYISTMEYPDRSSPEKRRERERISPFVKKLGEEIREQFEFWGIAKYKEFITYNL